VFLTHPPMTLDVHDVCVFWSTASGLIQQGC
jgi:hypothetical protein